MAANIKPSKQELMALESQEIRARRNNKNLESEADRIIRKANLRAKISEKKKIKDAVKRSRRSTKPAPVRKIDPETGEVT